MITRTATKPWPAIELARNEPWYAPIANANNAKRTVELWLERSSSATAEATQTMMATSADCEARVSSIGRREDAEGVRSSGHTGESVDGARRDERIH